MDDMFLEDHQTYESDSYSR